MATERTLTMDAVDRVMHEANRRIKDELLLLYGEKRLRYKQVPELSPAEVRIVIDVYGELVRDGDWVEIGEATDGN